MSHFHDIQRRLNANTVIPFVIYVCFLGIIFFSAIHFSWQEIPLEILILPICLVIPLFQHRFYLSLMLLLSTSVIVGSQFFSPIIITNNPLFIILVIVCCVEIMIFLYIHHKQRNHPFVSQAESRFRRLSALRSIDLSMISNHPLQDTLNIVVQEITTQFQVDVVNIFILNKQTDFLAWSAGNTFSNSFLQSTLQNHPVKISNDKKNIQILKIDEDNTNHPQLSLFAKEGYRVYIVLPLVFNHVLIGTLEILNKKAFQLEDDFIGYLETLGGQAAIAIDHATSLANLQEINHTLQSTIKELTETKEVLEKSQHIGRIGSWRYKLTSGRVEWTQALFDIYGIQAQAVQPAYATIFENILPEDIHRVRKQMDGLLKGENIFELEYRIQHPDGEIRNLITMCEAFRDEKGQVIDIIGTVRDRTEHKHAEMQLHETHMHLQQSYDSTLEGWAHALDLRDHGTEGHSQRVTQLSLQLAEILQIPVKDYIHIRRGAILHDIGKIGIPDTILLKPGKLTAEEWQIMRQHPQFAYDMLSHISYLQPALDIPYCHHEKWDGSGYPQGLKGTDIPLSARIFAVVDVLDALVSDRPYRKAWTLEEAKEYIVQQSGTQFDPQIISALIANWKRIKF